ncbi:MAG: flagellar hook protein FlgE, partial [Desulfocapsa sp.]|nr:flagellar hook protein FlgE [Desulfocapsa sp.]
MGITSALYSGVSGLNTNSQAMSVIGNNLANTNTLGFKGARTVFSDLLASNISGSGGSSQVGRGVNVSKVDNIFSQGTFESTSSNTDVAIEGEGFFLLKEPGDNTTYYSRAGAFRFDQDGYLVNPEGFRVQGKPFDDNGDPLPGDPESIQVANVGLVPAKVTDAMTFNTNLDASEIPPVNAFDPTDPAT